MAAASVRVYPEPDIETEPAAHFVKLQGVPAGGVGGINNDETGPRYGVSPGMQEKALGQRCQLQGLIRTQDLHLGAVIVVAAVHAASQ